PRLERVCTSEYRIPGTDVIIKEGDMVAVPIYGLHMDEQYFPNPEKFDPERFNPENKSDRSPYVFHPFGHGPRNCIGNVLIVLFMRTPCGLTWHHGTFKHMFIAT